MFSRQNVKPFKRLYLRVQDLGWVSYFHGWSYKKSPLPGSLPLGASSGTEQMDDETAETTGIPPTSVDSAPDSLAAYKNRLMEEAWKKRVVFFCVFWGLEGWTEVRVSHVDLIAID